jgi:hypothetical protein
VTSASHTERKKTVKEKRAVAILAGIEGKKEGTYFDDNRSVLFLTYS